MIPTLINATCLTLFMACCLIGLAIYFVMEQIRQSPASAVFFLNVLRRWMGL